MHNTIGYFNQTKSRLFMYFVRFCVSEANFRVLTVLNTTRPTCTVDCTIHVSTAVAVQSHGVHARMY